MKVGNREIDPSSVPGTREHAESVTVGRHPGVQSALQWLTYSHLPQGLQVYSQPFYAAAVELVRAILTDSAELTTALNKLIEAKDSAVRAGIRDSTGRAGSVPRPQTVVEPPVFEVGRDVSREIDRNARAYGFEIGRGQAIAENLVSSPDNSFLDLDWADKAGLSRRDHD
jgi:hypothetical protein